MNTAVVVDDSRMVRHVIGRALESHGFSVEPLEDGARALRRLTHGPAPDLLMCDVSMPKVNGLELLEELRDAGVALHRVVIVSIEGHPDLMARAKELGVDAWLLKPVRPELILAAVDKVMQAA